MPGNQSAQVVIGTATSVKYIRGASFSTSSPDSCYMTFAKAKEQILANLGVVDYSPKGSVDHEIVPLINLVNSHPRYVTTSSCAGRLSIFIEGVKSRMGGKGDGGAWLYFTHDYRQVRTGWINGFHNYEHSEPVPENEPRRYVLYKFEPFVLHVKCADHQAACQLFSAAMSCGFRESGIGSNDIVAIRISLRIDAPIGYLKGKEIVPLVSDDYIHELDTMTLDMFAKNQVKISLLTQKVQELIDHESLGKQETETFEQRRERKRREGLQRQSLNQSTAQETPENCTEMLETEEFGISW